ncbi:Hypothetical predicted protein [Lecanosticta acicola]|uniref:Uncharacterized protein n=1 Tax=Lecanosticta acicola TaxID=111012 RepID=A0AAI8VUQ8_9PEZI|nr:Hypothetical predicted protein [Lecanosticta acicola]
MARDVEVTDEAVRRLIESDMTPKPDWGCLRNSLEDWRYSTERKVGTPIREHRRYYDPQRESSRNYINPGYPNASGKMKADIVCNRYYQLKIELDQAIKDPPILECVQRDIDELFPNNWINRARVWAECARAYEEYEAELSWAEAQGHEEASRRFQHAKRPKQSSMRNFKALRKTRERVVIEAQDGDTRTPMSASGRIAKPWPETERMKMTSRAQERLDMERRLRKRREDSGNIEKRDVTMGGVPVDQEARAGEEGDGRVQQQQQPEDAFDEYYDISPITVRRIADRMRLAREQQQ